MSDMRKNARPSARRSRKRVDEVTIGTHARSSQRASRRASHGGSMNASHVEFSNARASKRASRGYVNYVTPSTRSGESDAAYRRRSSRVGYAQGVQRKSKARSVVVVLAVLILAVLVAVGVGVFTYFKSSDSKLSLSDSAALEALAAQPQEGAYYTLFAAELGSAVASGGAETEAYVLARIDEASKLITLVGIPSNLSVYLSDGAYHPLYEAREVGGDAELIAKVAEFTGVGVSHYVRTDVAGITQLVNLFGDIEIELPEEVDDPDAGTLHLEAGVRQLDADAALTVLRADNLSGGITAREQTRMAFCLEMLRIALVSEGLDFAAVVADVAEGIQTDWTASQLLSLGKVLQPYDDLRFYSTFVPGYESDGSFVVYDAEWDDLMAKVDAGLDPATELVSSVDVDRAKVSVEVRNGGGVTGMGAKMGEILGACGYVVEGVGNTDDGATYPETLVIYSDDAHGQAAEAIVEDAGIGRVVHGGSYYQFETDVLVIVGQDWLPVE